MNLNPDEMAKSREDFEKIMKDIYPHRSIERLPDDSCYEDRDTFYLFLGWKLRQESITVELPAMFHDSVSGYEADEMKTAIKSAGINYREKE